MFKRFTAWIIAIAVVATFTSSSLAEINSFEVTADLNYSSVYMWRGLMLDGDPVLQPGIYIKTPPSKLWRLKFGYWRSQPLDHIDGLRSKEIDYIMDYTYNFKNFDLSIGHTYYDYPDLLNAEGSRSGFSRESYVAITLPKVFLSPSLYYYYDYGKKDEGGGHGSYAVLNLAYSKPFSVKKIAMSLDVSGHAGFNNKLYFRGHGGDMGLSAGMTVLLGKHLSIKPNVSYSLPWGNYKDKDNGNQKTRVYTGAYISFAL